MIYKNLGVALLALGLAACASTPPAQSVEVAAAQMTEEEKLAAAAKAEMTHEEKVAAYNEQQADKEDKVVCRTITPTGSHRKKTICRTVSEIKKDRDSAQDAMRQMQNPGTAVSN